jgi:SAM-dependent methyltransferase
VLGRLANRDRVHTEATVQADIRQLLLSGGLGLEDHDLEVDLEAPVGGRRRIDIEVGFTVIEVKKDLRKAAVVKEATKQLAGYVASRAEQTGQRYVGILTDGADWRAYHLRGNDLVEVTRFELKPSRPGLAPLLMWLEGVLAVRTGVPPTPSEIVARLGATSTSYALDKAALTALYDEYGTTPTVQLKRQLWSRLLRSALGTQFTDTDELFLEHTLLVNSAEVIAHLVLGLDVADMQPATLLAGQRFEMAQIYGVVEQDFFDWVLEVPGGESFVRTMARRVARFDWTNVDHDVLKVLYESVIGAETRKRLGEYYTPDWLADQIVAEAVTDPLKQRVLDPACGSGTFLFHAVRRYLSSADETEVPLFKALSELTEHVLGIDLHPVAVSLARVTYLLAIGRERLIDSTRGPITVPIYLGDSVQWTQRVDLFSGGQLLIPTGTGDKLFEDELSFPDHLLANAGWFDRLIDQLASLATEPRANKAASLAALFRRLAVPTEDQAAVAASFEVLCRLHDKGRDHIWSYYVRNLVRPVWLGRSENRVDVLVGNPPWLSYRHMPSDMQDVFHQMSDDMGLWHGRTVATHQDLSALFVARSVQQYLKLDGAFAFVMPNAALDRGYYKGFRTGRYPDPSEPTTVAFSGSWDLRRLRPHFFPRGGSVVFGERTAEATRPLPVETTRWTGTLPRSAHTWPEVEPYVTRSPAELVISDDDSLAASPYGRRFSQGANIVPRVLFFVKPQPDSPLGLGAGRRAVQSRRSSAEKEPWKSLPDMTDKVVETEFVRPVLVGENVISYRILPLREAVLPLEGNKILDSNNPHLGFYPDLEKWWGEVEKLWNAHRSTDNLTLAEQLDYRSKLTQQLPLAPLRLVYGASGMHVVAALVETPNSIVEHGLYWGAITSHAEGWYLCAILNCPELTQLVRPLMSYGKDERHIDKHVWKLPIPLYDPDNPVHRRLAELGHQEAQLVASLDMNEQRYFVSLRQDVREALAAGSGAEEIADIVTGLLD